MCSFCLVHVVILSGFMSFLGSGKFSSNVLFPPFTLLSPGILVNVYSVFSFYPPFLLNAFHMFSLFVLYLHFTCSLHSDFSFPV